MHIMICTRSHFGGRGYGVLVLSAVLELRQLRFGRAGVGGWLLYYFFFWLNLRDLLVFFFYFFHINIFIYIYFSLNLQWHVSLYIICS